ncbi:serine hydrolase domain-containing protein [Algiphilus sp. W345]|uniref:Serine hydrolase domain-containing protein n=1 Tax=Banduia mediterranea TaxID=3075609 RepID=A0ABU2WGG7_9GAMM|nr:serine hydrolase domain-containing protein [Algiphilus sp. W345]MDT0496969.1 serine hydrolase domain-containing protein [Algiphilus sp. W345]
MCEARPLREVLLQRFTRPLGLNHMSYGLPLQQHALAAENAFTGPRLVPPIGYIAKRILGVRFEDVATISNEPGFLSATIPAGNIYASADDACLFFQMLLNGGELNGTRVLEPETIARAVAPIGYLRLDSSLLLPVRFSAGMVSGERLLGLYGLNCAEAYGHLGFINIICWADPARDISVALLNTGKSMAVDGVARLAQLVGAISRHCPRT